MTRRSILLIGIALICLSASGCIQISAFGPAKLETVFVEKSPRWFERNRIAIVDINGFIGSGVPSLITLSSTTVADVKEKLSRAADDDGVRAVILRIDSPGGDATSSDIIHQEIMRFRKRTGKPVVACLLGTAASGGYYAACAADSIVASPTTVTGSVGVIMTFMNAEELYRKIGLSPEVIKSGGKKDIGSSTRGMTEAERELMQKINLELFNRFLYVVHEGRKDMTEEELRVISDGRIVTAQQALALHMVDRIGYPDDAVEMAKTLADIETADVIIYRSQRSANSNIYASMGSESLIQAGLETFLRRLEPAFLYLWSPGE